MIYITVPSIYQIKHLVSKQILEFNSDFVQLNVKCELIFLSRSFERDEDGMKNVIKIINDLQNILI